MKYKGLAAFLSVVLYSIPLAGVVAQTTTASVHAFPDFLAVRSEFLSALITAAPPVALNFKTVYRDTPTGRVRISVEREGASFYVMFQRDRDGNYPVASRGNLVIKREATTGYVLRVVWFLSDDGLSFLSLTPKNERTIVDYVVAGSVVRSGYSVSRLIYYFFTNNFNYLYDATRSGVDWSLVLSAPGSTDTAAFAADLISGRPAGLASELVRVASDFSTIGLYLAAAGKSGFTPEEVTATSNKQIASFLNPRDPVFKAVSGWTESSGIPLDSAALAIISGIGTESAYIALVTGAGTQSPTELAIVPYRDAAGLYVINAVDANTRLPVDFMALVSSRSGASIRLFRIPLPTSP
jgi:hypothetical protein